MRKLHYKFEDGTIVNTLKEAEAKKNETGCRWVEFFEEEKVPNQFVEDGVSWEAAGKVRVANGLVQMTDVATRGFFVTTREEAARNASALHDLWREKAKKFINEYEQFLSSKENDDEELEPVEDNS